MSTDTIGVLIWIFFIALHFTTQELYCSKYHFAIITLLLALSTTLFIFLNRKYPELKFQYSAFLIFYQAILLFAIKIGYKRFNTWLIQKDWVPSLFLNKDFTYVTHPPQGIGNDIWDKRIASKPLGLIMF